MSLLHEMARALRSPADARVAEACLACGLDPYRHVFGVDWVTFAGVHYEPVPEGGDSALIVPVCEANGCDIVDLAACRLRDRRLATRHGIGRALGEDWIADAIDRQQRLLLFADPVRWLGSHCCGAVVLDWSAVPFLFVGLPEIVCESASLARRVHAATRRLADPPRLLVYTERTRRHAA